MEKSHQNFCLYFVLCSCEYLCIHLYVWVSIHLCAHACGSQRLTSGVFLSHTPPYFLWQCLSPNQEFNLVFLAHPQAPGISASPALGFQASISTPVFLLFNVGAGDLNLGLYSFIGGNKHFTNWAISPGSKVTFCYKCLILLKKTEKSCFTDEASLFLNNEGSSLKKGQEPDFQVLLWRLPLSRTWIKKSQVLFLTKHPSILGLQEVAIWTDAEIKSQ